MGSVNWDALGGDLLDDVIASDDTGIDFGDQYEVSEVLGEGGQGIVYLAHDRLLERQVAIKTLRDPGQAQRPLLEEGRLLSRLAHPAIPQVYARGTAPNGGAYVVLQYIKGRRLDQWLRDLKPDLGARLRLFRGLAGAVGHAHARGVLHRDLKPENVMVSEAGEPYLVDWGLAANGGPRAVCGSPYFAAPEQLDNQPVDARVDVYALGVLLYVILSEGQLPYARRVSSFDEFQRQRAALSQVRLRDRNRSLPAGLERICETAMAAQPGARYQSVAELLADLDAMQGGRPLARDLPGLPWRGVITVLAVVCALAVGVVIGRSSSQMGSGPESARGSQGPATAPLPPARATDFSNPFAEFGTDWSIPPVSPVPPVPVDAPDDGQDAVVADPVSDVVPGPANPEESAPQASTDTEPVNPVESMPPVPESPSEVEPVEHPATNPFAGLQGLLPPLDAGSRPQVVPSDENSDEEPDAPTDLDAMLPAVDELAPTLQPHEGGPEAGAP